jgi:hypothetical protein
VAAYPKSAFALMLCHERNLAIARLLTYAEQLGRSDHPDAHDLIARAMTEATHQHRVLAWIACTPGPGLPFPELERDPELPPTFAELAPQDIVAICRAFDEVNWARLRALEALVAPDPDAEDAPRGVPPGRSSSASITATEGRASEHVLRDRSLAGLMATTQMAASAQREAMADAKEKGAHEGRGRLMSGRRISELFYELRANTEGLKRDLDDGQRQLGKFSQFVERTIRLAVVGALGVALAGVGIEAVAHGGALGRRASAHQR